MMTLEKALGMLRPLANARDAQVQRPTRRASPMTIPKAHGWLTSALRSRWHSTGLNSHMIAGFDPLSSSGFGGTRPGLFTLEFAVLVLAMTEGRRVTEGTL